MTTIIQRLGAWLEKRDRARTLALIDQIAAAARLPATPARARCRTGMSRCRTRTVATMVV